ncbi:hypothetical protein ZWY2020_032231 [Hordeum vulgare]|nr:hypothetical protein ZWY2020_032231 [Hordeum vulgare]
MWCGSPKLLMKCYVTTKRRFSLRENNLFSKRHIMRSVQDKSTQGLPLASHNDKFITSSTSSKNKDKMAKYINVPIANFDEMGFIFQDKHAIGEVTVLQTPYDRVRARDKDFISDTKNNVSDVEVDPATHYDSYCLTNDTNNESSSSKCP